MVARTLLRHMNAYGTLIHGSDAFWYEQGQNLEAIFDNYPPHIFFTHSYADTHNGILAKLLEVEPQPGKSLTTLRTKAAQSNPHISVAYFEQRSEDLRKYFFKEILDYKYYWDRGEWQGRGVEHKHGAARLKTYEELFDHVKIWVQGQMASKRLDDEYFSAQTPLYLKNCSSNIEYQLLQEDKKHSICTVAEKNNPNVIKKFKKDELVRKISIEQKTIWEEQAKEGIEKGKLVAKFADFLVTTMNVDEKLDHHVKTKIHPSDYEYNPQWSAEKKKWNMRKSQKRCKFIYVMNIVKRKGKKKKKVVGILLKTKPTQS